jgi:hypothetical protein
MAFEQISSSPSYLARTLPPITEKIRHRAYTRKAHGFCLQSVRFLFGVAITYSFYTLEQA